MIYITFEQFDEIIKLVKKQYDSDNKLCDFLEGYFDGNMIPTFNENYHNAIMKLLKIAFCDDNDNNGWIDWFVYECNFGDNPMQCKLDGIEYKISSSLDFYNFMLIYNEKMEK